MCVCVCVRACACVCVCVCVVGTGESGSARWGFPRVRCTRVQSEQSTQAVPDLLNAASIPRNTLHLVGNRGRAEATGYRLHALLGSLLKAEAREGLRRKKCYNWTFATSMSVPDLCVCLCVCVCVCVFV